MRRGATAKIPGAETYVLYEALPWPVYNFEIVLRPLPGLAAVYKYRYRSRTPNDGPKHKLKLNWWRLSTQGTAERVGGDISGPLPASARNWVPWPADGVLVPKLWDRKGRLRPAREYDPLSEADDMIQHISRIDLEDPATIRSFANRWGLLDQGEFANVAEVRTGLEFISGIASAVHRVSSDPGDLAWDLSIALAHVQHAVKHVSGCLRLVFKAPRLIDVLGLRVAEVATRPEEDRFRRCEYSRCGALFVPQRRDQRYCQTGGEQICARRASLERFRAHQHRKGRSKQRLRRRTRR